MIVDINSPWIKFPRLDKIIQTRIKNNETNIFIFSHQICLLCLTHFCDKLKIALKIARG